MQRQWRRQEAERQQAARQFARQLQIEEAKRNKEEAKREAKWKAADQARENARRQLDKINRRLAVEKSNIVSERLRRGGPTVDELPATNPFAKVTNTYQPNPFAKPSVPAESGGQNSASCSDITGTGSGGGPVNCPSSAGGASVIQKQLASGQANKLSQPRPRSPAGITPLVQTEILELADLMLDTPDDDAMRTKFRHRLERRLADHQTPLKQQGLDCLQPASGIGHRMVDVALRWHPYQIKIEAIDRSGLCKGVAEGSDKEACRESKYGQAVMWAEPEIAGQCRTATMPNQDTAAVAECAKRKFDNVWAKDPDGILSAPAPDRWTTTAMCSAKASPTEKKKGLRELLLAALAATKAEQNESNEETGQVRQPLSGSPVAGDPPPSQMSDGDEAYCSYMAREVVRGELIPGGGIPIPQECKATIAGAKKLKAAEQANGRTPFSMSHVGTDSEIKRLLRESPVSNRPK